MYTEIEILNIVFFFFSSRRRHTRSLRDWSSDVCSSDLLGFILALQVLIHARHSSVGEAQRTFADYVALVERNGFGPQHPSVNPQRGLLAFLGGEMEAALGYLNRQPGLRVDRFAEPEPLLAQLSSVLIAAIHYERNEI